MKVGIHLPQWGASATREGVLSVARAAEAAGVDSVWVADHVVFPADSTSTYPYRKAGVPFTPEDGFLEGLTMLAAVAGATDRVFLGTSVLVLPMREPLLTAKTIATMDVLSGGRVTVAVGAGWWREEFDALGAPFAGRGARFDDQLDILREAWSSGHVRGRGHYGFGEVACLPRPVQPGGPRIWIGGLGPASLRRVVRVGDGWHAVGSDLTALRDGRRELDRLAAAAGRDPASIAVSTSTGFGRGVEQALDRLLALAGAGVDQVVLNVGGPDATAADVCRTLDDFAIHIRPVLDNEARVTADSARRDR